MNATTHVGAPFDRSVPPLADDVRGARFPDFEHRRLSNGLDLYLGRWAHYPLVNVQLLLPAGGQWAEPGAAGLASLHGALLDEGTETRSALEIAATIERLGGFLGTGADWDVAYASSTVLRPHLGAGLELLADLILSPSFPAEEVERIRHHRLADILRSKVQPSTLADRALARVIYEGTVYAEPLIGTEESIGALTQGDLRAFYDLHMRPEGATLLAVGDIDPNALEQRAEDIFGDWTSPGPRQRPVITAPERQGFEIHIVDRPGSAQTELVLGRAGISRDDPDHPKALMLSIILGGQFTSRLNLNLREKQGITYGIQSQFVYRQGRGPFVLKASVATDAVGTATREIFSEMKRLREEPVPEEEMRQTRDYVIGVFPITLQTIGDLAKRLETLAVFGLPDDYYKGYPAILSEVTGEDVQTMARKYLDPERLVLVAVGPGEELRGQLEKLGPVKVWTP